MRYLGYIFLLLTMLACRKEVPEKPAQVGGGQAGDITVFYLSGSPDKPFCIGPSDKIILDVDLKQQGVTYRWTPGGETTPRKYIEEPGSYSVKMLRKTVESAVFTATVCPDDTNTVKGNDSAMTVFACIKRDEVLRLEYPDTAVSGKIFFWTPGGNSTSYKYVSTQGFYTLNVIDSQSTAQLGFSIDTCVTPIVITPLNIFSTSSGCVSFSQRYELDATVPAQGDSISYSWTPGGQKTPKIIVNNPGTYKVSVERIKESSITADVTRCEEEKVNAPNAFSPNNDGYNDTWKVTASGIKNIAIEVRSEEGILLFSTGSVAEGWNGTYEGRSVPEDIYLYHISYTTNSGVQSTLKGQVQLRR